MGLVGRVFNEDACLLCSAAWESEKKHECAEEDSVPETQRRRGSKEKGIAFTFFNWFAYFAFLVFPMFH